MAERSSLADLKAEVARTRPVRKAPGLAAAPGNLTRAEVIPDKKRLPAADTKAQRVQKNLRILKTDADRMQRLARSGKVSQTVLLSLALDAYEASLQTNNDSASATTKI
ncbi:MAG: hypothetical protein AAFS01_05500 [Pseudomonadota bacterium]